MNFAKLSELLTFRYSIHMMQENEYETIVNSYHFEYPLSKTGVIKEVRLIDTIFRVQPKQKALFASDKTLYDRHSLSAHSIYLLSLGSTQLRYLDERQQGRFPQAKRIRQKALLHDSESKSKNVRRQRLFCSKRSG
jgi:hypothetical protein